MDFSIGRILFNLINPQLLLKKEQQAELNRNTTFGEQIQQPAQNTVQNQNQQNAINNFLNQNQQNVAQNQNQQNTPNNVLNQNQQNVMQNQNQTQQNTLNNVLNQNQQNVVQNQNQNQQNILNTIMDTGQPNPAPNQPTLPNPVQNQPILQNSAQNQPVVPNNTPNQPATPAANNVLPEQNNIITNNLVSNASSVNAKPQVPEQQNRIGDVKIEHNYETPSQKNNQDNLRQNIENLVKMTDGQKTNNFTPVDRSVYVKNLLGLPQNLGDILRIAQNVNKPLAGGTLGLANINAELLQNQKILSELFEELNPAVQNTQQMVNMLNAQMRSAQAQQDAVALMFSGMVSLPDISKLILQNSKQAIAALIISIATASKNGLNGKHLQDTLSVINSCVSMAESDNPALNLKSLMMLYLPWLPLNDGIGFDLEISTPDGENESNDSKLTVLIQTKNYGNLKGVFTLTTSNSVDVYIICSDKFPKNILEKCLMSESSSHAMNSNIDIEEIKPIKEELNENREAKVNLSATNEMNPYLLLMAHSFIRNTIMIDNNSTIPIMAAS